MNKTKGIGINEPVCLIHRDLWDHEKGQPLSKGESAHTPRETKDHIRNSRDTWEQVALKAAAERDRLMEQRDELLAALKCIRAEMDALKRDEPNPNKQLQRLGARFDWNLVVYEPIKHAEGAGQ